MTKWVLCGILTFCLLGFCLLKYQDYKYEKRQREVKTALQLLPGMGIRAAEIAKSLENAPTPEGLPQTIEYPALVYSIDRDLKQSEPRYLTADAGHSEVYLGEDGDFLKTSDPFAEYPSVDVRSVRSFVIDIEGDCHGTEYEFGSVLVCCTDRVFVLGKDSGKLTAYRSFAPGEPPAVLTDHSSCSRGGLSWGDWLGSLPAPQ